jgi:hypothetical protein
VALLRKSTPGPPDPEPAVEDEASTGPAGSASKGRPTPKRRDIAPKRQPLSAPRTAKEASRLRKQQAALPRSARPAAKKMSTREYREALRRGDESVLPRKDRGPVRKLARDWVDTHFLVSNFLLLALPLLLFTSYIPYHVGQYATLALAVMFAIEWLWTGRRIHALASSRLDKVVDKPWVLGLYAGQRAFLPRRWRAPAATLRRGDKI